MAGANVPGVEVPCPRCKRPSASIKQYTLIEWFVCAFIFFWARRATYTACSGCMRVIVLERFAYNLVPANIAMVALGPIYLFFFLRTFQSGHSEEIQSRIAEAQRQNEHRLVVAQTEMSALLAALPSAIARLDRGERDSALEELKRTTATFEKGGHAELIMTDYIKWLEGGYFDAMRDLFIPNQPEFLRAPLMEFLDKYTGYEPV